MNDNFRTVLLSPDRQPRPRAENSTQLKIRKTQEPQIKTIDQTSFDFIYLIYIILFLKPLVVPLRGFTALQQQQ